MAYNITTQGQVRRSFWTDLQEHTPGKHVGPRYGWKQNQYPTDIRVAFCDHVEHLRRNDQISEELANKVTL